VLHANMKKHLCYRVRKEDVLKDLPAKRQIVVPVMMSDPKEYQHALRDFIDWMRKRNPSRMNAAEKAERLVQIGYLRRLAGRLKLPAVFDWIDSFLAESDAKLLCFAVHKVVIAALKERYQRRCVVVDGSVTGRKRQEAFDAFVKGKPRLFVGNVQAAGTGWSATGVSDVLIAEYPWQPGTLSQAADRCHGLNRGKEGVTTTVYNIVARDSIEERLLDILQAKQEVIDLTLDGRTSKQTMNIFDLLTEELLKGE